MAKKIIRKYSGDTSNFRISPASPGIKMKQSKSYNILSFIIKFNKSISITAFIIFSGFLFVYCSSTDSNIEEQLQVEKIQTIQSAETENTELKNHELVTPIQPLTEKEPDLRNIISILNLDYSDEKLHGVFWGEHDFNSKVYLSFDDGPNMSLIQSESDSDKNSVCDTILNILKERNLKAVFFINGKNLEYANPSEKKELYRVILRMINEGHLIGNHSYNHHNLAKGLFIDGENDQNDIANEFILTQNSLNELLEFAYPLVLVRPPYAEPGRTADLDNWLISKKQYLISLQFDSYDYAYKKDGYWNEQALFERMESLLSEQKNGGVLLLHELDSTAMLLADLLDNIILERGYAVESMEELLEEKYGRKS